MDENTFEQLVADGIDALPPKVHALMENVAVVIEEAPSAAVREAHRLTEDATLFGLYEGVPLTERGVDYSELPDKITIFRRPILAVYSDHNDIRECVANTVWHEVAHHFGYNEAWVHEAEVRTGRTK